MKARKQGNRTTFGAIQLALVVGCCALLATLVIASFNPSATAHAEDIFAPAPNSGEADLQQKLNKRGEITFRQTRLADALTTLGEAWHVNIVVSEGLEGEVSGVFRDAPLYEILDSILHTGGYVYVPIGRSLVIRKADSNASMNPMFETASIRLIATKPEEVIEGARMLASPQGRVQAIPSANSIVVFDFPAQVERIRRFVTQLDMAAAKAAGNLGSGDPVQAWSYAPQYIEAKALKDIVQQMLTKDGKVGIMELENRVVIVDYPEAIALIRETICQLDVPRPQVRIRALIYDISIEDMERLGINWGSAGIWDRNTSGVPTGLLGVDSLMTLPPIGEPSGTITLMNLSQHFDIKCVIEALASLRNARLLADPNVVVVDRERASIQIVTEIPYQQLTQTAGGGQIGTTAFREAGVSLFVVPMIANDGTVQMEVTPTFSRLTGYTHGEPQQPIIDKREAKTTVRVLNGQTLVIGGLRQRHDIRDRRGVPYLMDLSFFGHFFRSRVDEIKESELVVFITPEIVMPTEPPLGRNAAAACQSRAVLERIPVAPDLDFPCYDYVEEVPSWQTQPGAPVEAIPPGMIQNPDQSPSSGELYTPSDARRRPATNHVSANAPIDRNSLRRIPSVNADPQVISAPRTAARETVAPQSPSAETSGRWLKLPRRR